MKILNKFFLILLLISCIFLEGCNNTTKYEDASTFNEGLAAVKLRSLYGFIDTEKNLVITPTYEEAYPFSDGMALVKKNGLWGAIDKKNNVVIPFNYEEATIISDNLLSVKQNNNYGCVDFKGNIIIDFISQNPILIYNHNNKNIAIITENNYQGFIDLDTNFKVEPKYTGIMPFYDNNSHIISLECNRKFGFVNLDTKTIVEPKYSNSLSFNGELSPVSIDGKFGYINIKDEIVIEPIYNSANPFYNGLANVSLNGKTGCIDKTGKIVIPIIYDYITPFYQNYVTTASIDGKVSLINTKGQLLFEPKFQNIDFNSENDMFPASYVDEDINIKYVFINKKGEIVLNTDYTGISSFHNGLATVSNLGKYGIIASNGMEIVPPIYDEVYGLDEQGDTFQVCLKSKWGIVDKTQKEILKCEYDIIETYNNNIYKISKDGKWGLFNKSSNKSTDIIYDDMKLSYEDNSPIAVELDDHWFYINEDGNKIK